MKLEEHLLLVSFLFSLSFEKLYLVNFGLILSALCEIWVTVGNKISLQGWSMTKTETLVDCATFYSNLGGTLSFMVKLECCVQEK